MLTNLKDVDREILKYIDDKELLKICSINKKAWNHVCDDDFLKRRLSKYPEIQQYKEENESWKRFFSRLICCVSKMEKDYNFVYIYGDFMTQYTILKDNKRYKLFITACEKGEMSLVIHCIENRVYCSMSEALLPASRCGHLEIVKYLINKGADVAFCGHYALRAASGYGHLEIVKYLVGQGSDIHVYNDQCLVVSSKNGHLPMVKYLVEQGADIHTVNDFPLRLAKGNKHYDVVKYLKSFK